MRCKAKSKRSGDRCKNHSMREREVCRIHGGKAGAPKNNANAVKHGAYATLMRERLPEDQREAFDRVSVDSELAAELRINRFKLLALLGEVDQNVHGKDGTWVIKADEFEKLRGIVILTDNIRKLVKDMQDIGEDDPLLQMVRAWQEGMESEDATGAIPETT